MGPQVGNRENACSASQPQQQAARRGPWIKLLEGRAMIDFEEAKALALGCFEACGEEIVVLDVTERSWGWVFICNTKQFAETKDPLLMLVGHGPIFVVRETGRVIETGSAHSTETYLERFEATGDPHQRLGCVVAVSGHADAPLLEIATYLHQHYALPLRSAKQGLDALADGAAFEIRTEDDAAAARLVAYLRECGFVAHRLPEP